MSRATSHNAKMAGPSAKQVAGLALLDELHGDFETVHDTLSKVVANIVGSPAELKFRRLRTGNARITSLLQAPGARQLLLGSGFVEEADALALPEAADLAPLRWAADALRAQQAKRKEAEERKKSEAVAEQRARALATRKASEKANTGPQAKAAHILLVASAEAPLEACEKRIAGWKAELDDTPHHLMPGRFAELAKAHSACQSGSRGGALGFFPQGKMVAEFDAVAFDLAKPTGKLYGPVRTEHGAHLIFVQARLKGSE